MRARTALPRHPQTATTGGDQTTPTWLPWWGLALPAAAFVLLLGLLLMGGAGRPDGVGGAPGAGGTSGAAGTGAQPAETGGPAAGTGAVPIEQVLQRVVRALPV